MKKRVILLLLFGAVIRGAVSADIMDEIAKRDSEHPIRLVNEYSRHVLYAEDGYLHTEYRSDESDIPSIVAYKIREDAVTLIVRIKTQELTFTPFDYFYKRDRIDQFYVDVHDYYLVELVYAHDRLETYCNRVYDINTNGFVYNDAKIGGNIKEASGYYQTFPRLETDLTEGMDVRIDALTNERTNAAARNSYTFKTYDYYYQIMAEGRQVQINGYLLDFSDTIDYRAPLLVLKSGNTDAQD